MIKAGLTKLVCIVLVGAVSLSCSSGVLCYGDDGHVAIELMLHDHCGHSGHEDDSSHRESEHPVFVISDACSPCTDVLMGQEREPVRKQQSNPCGQAEAVAVLGDVLTACGCKDACIIPDQTPFFTPLKSIVLLT
ncbi:MAG: hypothetical protein ACYSO1_05055 [Planctomycetota bacterium]|jgi:hypothetical protein